MISAQQKGRLLLAFSMALPVSAGAFTENIDNDSVPYRQMKHADIYVPVTNYRQIGDNRLRIEISTGGVNPLRFLFSKTASFSTDGYQENRNCPYIKFEKNDYTLEKTGRNKYVIEATLTPEAATHIRQAECLVTPRPPMSKINGS